MFFATVYLSPPQKIERCRVVLREVHGPDALCTRVPLNNGQHRIRWVDIQAEVHGPVSGGLLTEGQREFVVLLLAR